MENNKELNLNQVEYVGGGSAQTLPFHMNQSAGASTLEMSDVCPICGGKLTQNPQTLAFVCGSCGASPLMTLEQKRNGRGPAHNGGQGTFKL